MCQIFVCRLQICFFCSFFVCVRQKPPIIKAKCVKFLTFLMLVFLVFVVIQKNVSDFRVSNSLCLSLVQFAYDKKTAYYTSKKCKILDFKLSPCVKWNMFSFGCFPGFWVLIADVSEHCIGSIFKGRSMDAFEDGTDTVFRNVDY
jgi:hypothetical protein